MKRDTLPEMRKEAQESPQPSDNGNLDEAIRWVYKRYGTDLPAFFRDAYKEVERKNRESVESSLEAYPSGRSQP